MQASELVSWLNRSWVNLFVTSTKNPFGQLRDLVQLNFFVAPVKKFGRLRKIRLPGSKQRFAWINHSFFHFLSVWWGLLVRAGYWDIKSSGRFRFPRYVRGYKCLGVRATTIFLGLTGRKRWNEFRTPCMSTSRSSEFSARPWPAWRAVDFSGNDSLALSMCRRLPELLPSDVSAPRNPTSFPSAAIGK